MNPVQPSSDNLIWLMQLALSVTIVLAMITVVALVLGRNRPALRHALWLGGLVSVLALPCLLALKGEFGWTLTHLTLPNTSLEESAVISDRPVEPKVAPNAEGTGVAIVPDTAKLTPGPRTDIESSSPQAITPTPVKSSLQIEPGLGSVYSFILVTWIVGSGVLLARFTFRWRRLRRLLKEAHPISTDQRIAETKAIQTLLEPHPLPPIFVSTNAKVPMLIGLLAPRIVLPKAILASMNADEFKDTLIHESAHALRKDQWVLLLQQLALIAFWPHPLIHHMNREISRAREELCDNHVLTNSKPASYAETLLRLGQICLPDARHARGLTMIQRTSDLESRIRRLLDSRQDRGCRLGGWAKLGVNLVVCALIGGGVVVGVEPEQESIERRVIELTKDWDEMKVFDDAKTWAMQIRELAQIGKPAVPALINVLDQTDNDMTLRLLGFTLRAIGDPRATPALIRALPKTLREPASDYGLSVSDPELQKFMASNSKDDSAPSGFDLGRPINEISSALQKITGTTHGEDELRHVFLIGGELQREMCRREFVVVRKRWADWWNANWHLFVDQNTLDDLQPSAQPETDDASRFPKGADVASTGDFTNIIIGAIDERNERAVRDLDTGRILDWKQSLPNLGTQSIAVEEIRAWAARNGADLIGTRYPTPDGENSQYSLRGIGLQAWEVSNGRWHTIEEELRSDSPLQLGPPATDLLMHYDNEKSQLVPNRKATFLFITREGTTGMLRVTGLVTDKPAVGPQGQPDRRQRFEQVYGRGTPDETNPELDAEFSSRPVGHGIRIDYKYFYHATDGSTQP